MLMQLQENEGMTSGVCVRGGGGGGGGAEGRRGTLIVWCMKNVPYCYACL